MAKVDISRLVFSREMAWHIAQEANVHNIRFLDPEGNLIFEHTFSFKELNSATLEKEKDE